MHTHVRAEDARPAGRQGECFYCKQPLGHLHGIDCVVPKKVVTVRVVMDIEMSRPASFDNEMIEFGLNESSWCASNIAEEISEYVKRLDARGECLCGNCSFEVVEPAP